MLKRERDCPLIYSHSMCNVHVRLLIRMYMNSADGVCNVLCRWELALNTAIDICKEKGLKCGECDCL